VCTYKSKSRCPFSTRSGCGQPLDRKDKHAANVALPSHYIASFTTGENLVWGTPLGERPLTAEQPLLAHPRTG